MKLYNIFIWCLINPQFKINYKPANIENLSKYKTFARHR